MELDLDKFATAVTTGDGRAIAGLVLLVFVWASKRWTPDKYLATPTSKRIFTALLAGIPAVSLALMTHVSWQELVMTALTAFGLATGLHHLVDVKQPTTKVIETTATTIVEPPALSVVSIEKPKDPPTEPPPLPPAA